MLTSTLNVICQAYLQEREDVAQMAAPSGSTIVRGSAEVHKSKVKKKVMVTG